ncbi:MAG: hypothetical protein CMO01_18370 [Thalassobius sp.]|nr:hypothetical protein [Thalassovita sp.]
MDESFHHWVQGTGDKKNSDYWERIEQSSSESNALIQEAKKIARTVSYEKHELSKEEKSEIEQAIFTTISKDATQETKVIDRKNYFKPLSIAASIILLISIGIGYYFVNQQLNQTEETQELSYIEKVNPKGHKSTLKLPDGTSIKLNAESKLVFPSDFGQVKREVYLEGEAFFDVEPDAEKPFSVISGDITTTVLGTSFNVRAFTSDNKVQVAVTEGKVQVSKSFQDSISQNTSKLFLLPNQLGTYNKNDDELIKSEFDADLVLGWKEGKLVFKDSDFKEIVSKLERWYGVTIITQRRKKLEKDYTGIFINKSLETVLEGISFSFKFDYEINGKIVIIK